MRSRFDPVLRQAMNAWSRLAGRERILLASLAFVGLIAATLSSLDWTARQRDAHALAVADDAASRASYDGDQRAGPDTHRLRLLAESSVQGSDIWLARIGLEQHLVTAAGTAGIAAPRIIIDQPDALDPDLPVLHAEITAAYDGAALVRLLESLAIDQGVYFVDSLVVDKGDAAEFRLSLLFPVHLTKDERSQ